MTLEIKHRLNNLIEKYRFCFIVQGPFHSKYNEKRMQQFVENKNPREHEFVRVTADTTYVFWNPQKYKCIES